MKKNKLTIASITLIAFIILGSIYCNYSLNKGEIINEKSYAYENNDGLNQYLDKIDQKLSSIDNTFNRKDYVLSYNESPSDTNYETITLTYVIDNTIETNKTYDIIIENKEIIDIYVSTTETIDESDLIDRVNSFNNDVKESTLLKDYSYIFKQNKILNKDKSINQNRLVSSISRYEEKYTYNFDTKELLYILNIYDESKQEIKISIK